MVVMWSLCDVVALTCAWGTQWVACSRLRAQLFSSGRSAMQN